MQLTSEHDYVFVNIYIIINGELWTLFEFACSLYLTSNMVLDMDGNISHITGLIMYYDIFHIKIVWHKI